MPGRQGTADWVATVRAEKLAIAQGWLEACAHRGVFGPCIRSRGHELPHATSPAPVDTSHM